MADPQPPAGGDDPQPPAGDGVATTGQPPRGRRWWVRAADATLRVLGALIAVLAAVLSGLLELFLVPLRLQGHLVGASILMALVINLALAWFARHTVGSRWAVLLPWVAWTALMFLVAGTITDEGDYLLAADNWVPLPMILLGSVAFGAYAYRMILPPRAPRRPVAPGPEQQPSATADPAPSGGAKD